MAKGKYKRKRRRNTPIQDSGLSTRIVHLLEEAGIENMADLHLCSDEKLRSIEGIGAKAMEEIHAVKERI